MVYSRCAIFYELLFTGFEVITSRGFMLAARPMARATIRTFLMMYWPSIVGTKKLLHVELVMTKRGRMVVNK